MAKTEDIKAGRVGHGGEQRQTFPATLGIPDLDPLLQASTRFLEAWAALSNEVLEFSKARFDRGVDLGRAIARSTSINETIDLQTDFTRSAVQDYLSEANKLADIGTRGFLSGFQNPKEAEKTTPLRAEAAD